MAYNSTYTVRLLRAAESDLLEIVEKLAEEAPADAKTFLTKLTQELEQIAQAPLLAAAPSELGLAQAGYRYVTVDDFMVFFTLDGDRLLVHRILPGALEYKGAFRRV